MSLAWGAVVLLVLLLPGFLFFVGLHYPEQFTRETVERGAVGQVAGSVAVAVAVHGVLYTVISLACAYRWIPVPCVDLALALHAITLDATQSAIIDQLARNIRANSIWILLYVGSTSLSGFSLGWMMGARIAHGKSKGFAQHGWIYDLLVEDHKAFTFAYILTNVRSEKQNPDALGVSQDLRTSH
jgi:hypothetical protein